MSESPKRGREWLANKLSEASESIWHEPETKRFSFRSLDARVIDTRKPQPARSEFQARCEADNTARHELKASDAIALLSVRVRAYDRKQKRFVESWLRLALLKRIIERYEISRDGVSHDRYSVAMAYLCAHGIAEPHPNGANGYRWQSGYTSLRDRAEWLMRIAHDKGELKNVRSAHRYSIELD